MKRLSSVLLLLCFCLLALAGNEKKTFVAKLGHLIDKATMRGIDTTYIRIPERPWQLILRSNVNESACHMDASMSSGEGKDALWMSCKPNIDTGVGFSSGLWIGYRGYGLGYQKSISENDSYSFTFSACGSTYGLSLRLRNYEASKFKMGIKAGFPNDDNPALHQIEDELDMELDDPISVKSVFLEGYYLFNGNHYSNTAVFDQSAQQVKSAGSLMVGFTWFKSTITYDNQLNNMFFINLMNDVGKTKQWQFALGAGYAYNWVPQRRWLVSIQAMPMLTLLNNIKTWKYEMVQTFTEPADDDTLPSFSLVPSTVETTKSRVVPSGLARIGIVYNLNRFFLSATGQWSTYGYKHAGNSMRMMDWYVNTSVGIRF